MNLSMEDAGVINSDTHIFQDRCLYRWAGEPPREFCLHKVLFNIRRPADIIASGWKVVDHAVSELAASFRIKNVAPKIDWLKLNSVHKLCCLMGVHADETVAAAASINAQRKPFIPYRYFEKLSQNPEWRNLSCYCSYRHFIVQFNTGLTFYTDTHRMLCDVDYHAHFGIHGIHSLWATVKIDDRLIAIPYRLRLSENLSDLPGKVQKITQASQSFIRRLSSSWLYEQGQDELWGLAMKLLGCLSVPGYRINELKSDRELGRCLTKLDMLRFLSKIFPSNQVSSQSDLLKLSKTLNLQKKYP